MCYEVPEHSNIEETEDLQRDTFYPNDFATVDLPGELAELDPVTVDAADLAEDADVFAFLGLDVAELLSYATFASGK
jgi:hypothetical protein